MGSCRQHRWGKPYQHGVGSFWYRECQNPDCAPPAYEEWRPGHLRKEVYRWKKGMWSTIIPAPGSRMAKDWKPKGPPRPPGA